MKLADLESREVLLSKVAGVMLATLAKAVRTVDALRIKLEEGTEAPAPAAVDEAPAAEAVVEAPAEAAAEEAVVTEESSVEAPAEAEVDAVETAEAPVEETAETTEA
jgi:large subunit ribosomal protein L10